MSYDICLNGDLNQVEHQVGNEYQFTVISHFPFLNGMKKGKNK